jgi:mannose-1-phosphate guanylyltransferase
MKKTNFYAAILSGGSGERFWPLSTPERPKQFLSVFGGRTLIRQAVDRLRGLVPPERILIVTGKQLVAATRAELPEIPVENIVVEPCRRDTAAAVASACGVVEARGGENAVAAILTADQVMGDVKAFRRVLADSASAAACTSSIVTMGIKPTYPATGFGYICLGENLDLGVATPFRRASKFVEKPNEATARRYLASGRYVWNAGMFVWSVATMKAALAHGAPELADLEAAVAAAKRPGRVLTARYPSLPKISIDYAVMEKWHSIIAACGDFGWDDVGTWSAASRHLKADESGNVSRGDATLLDCSGLVAVSEGPRIAALGVKDLVVVAAGQSVLVADKSRVQDLKKLLAKMAK